MEVSWPGTVQVSSRLNLNYQIFELAINNLYFHDISMRTWTIIRKTKHSDSIYPLLGLGFGFYFGFTTIILNTLKIINQKIPVLKSLF